MSDQDSASLVAQWFELFGEMAKQRFETPKPLNAEAAYRQTLAASVVERNFRYSTEQLATLAVKNNLDPSPYFNLIGGLPSSADSLFDAAWALTQHIKLKELSLKAAPQAVECSLAIEPPNTTLNVDINAGTVVYKATKFLVEGDSLLLIDALVKAKGEWINGGEISEGFRPDRARKSLPRELDELIESKSGAGYRIKTR